MWSPWRGLFLAGAAAALLLLLREQRSPCSSVVCYLDTATLLAGIVFVFDEMISYLDDWHFRLRIVVSCTRAEDVVPRLIREEFGEDDGGDPAEPATPVIENAPAA